MTGWERIIQRVTRNAFSGGSKVGSRLHQEVDEPVHLGWFWRGLQNGPGDGLMLFSISHAV